MRFALAAFALVFYSTFGISQVSISKEPSWIINESYDLNQKVPENGAVGGIQILLYTEQVNIDLEERYVKGVSKVIEYSGIQNISTVLADYDPSYQNLSFHTIEVVRNGKTINKLSHQDIQTARRETNAENYIYDGTISAFVNIPDVRMGDVVLYSYTLKGFNPIQKNKFSTSFVLNSTQYINKLSIHVLSRKKINYDVINSRLEANYKINKGTHHYEWSHENIPAVLLDEQSPSWYFQNAMVVVSEYDSWAQVADWGNEIFTFKEPINTELKGVINNIKIANSTEGEKIKAALSFVQNEVRYLGLHSGIGGYKPNPPNKVMTQRFGDCKDKSILLTTILNEMGIEAYPALVNTLLRQVLPSMTPSSKLFDHCIVKVVDQRGNEFWYDPTLTDQGGNYDNVYTPDYRYGLVLNENSTEMDTISNFGSNMVKVFSKFKLDEMGKGAVLDVESTYYEGEADFMRGIFRNNNRKLINNELLKSYTEVYGRVTSVSPPIIVDDTLKNEFTLFERYQIDSVWEPSVENPKNLNFTINPTNITNVLPMPNQLDRSSPYELSFPMVRVQKIEISLPERVQIQPQSETINSDFFYYDFSSQYDNSSNILSLNYYYKNQDDHVPAESFNDYYQDMVKLDQILGYFIFMDKDRRNIAGNIGFAMGNYLGYAVISLIAVLGFVLVIVKIQKKENPL